MSIFEPLRRGAGEFIDTLGEGWDWLRRRGASALTRFRRSGRGDEDAPVPIRDGDCWGLLAANLAETDDDVFVRIEAPGLEDDDFSVSVISNELVVRGEKHFEREDKRAHYHLFESAYGAFERRFWLPCDVDADRTTARYRKGVLTIRLPRAEKDRRSRRRIHVKAA